MKAIEQDVGPFQVLVGPNGSGKTTFLDVIAFLGDLVRNRGEVRKTVFDRSFNYRKLLWLEKGADFQLAVEATIPEGIRKAMSEDKQRFSHVRYQVQIGLRESSDHVGLDHETLWFFEGGHKPAQPRLEFPRPSELPDTLLVGSSKRRKAAITKKPGGNDNYYTEGKKSYMPSFRLGRGKAALANVPADLESFPVSTWFQGLLEKGVQTFALNGLAIRQPSPTGVGQQFLPDGSNLPWVVDGLRKSPSPFGRWLEHVRTALPDVIDIETVEREEDRHRYLILTCEWRARSVVARVGWKPTIVGADDSGVPSEPDRNVSDRRAGERHPRARD